jgi:hypothetical protein
MNMRNWRLRPELFDALWAGTGQDRIPYPFRIVSAHPGLNAYVAEQNRIREAFAGAEHDDVRSALGVLAEPDVYVEISGSTADETPIRIVGAQQGQRVVIASQLPGRAPQIGGDVVIGAGAAGRLGAQLIGLIPQNAADSSGATNRTPTSLRESCRRSIGRPPPRDSNPPYRRATRAVGRSASTAAPATAPAGTSASCTGSTSPATDATRSDRTTHPLRTRQAPNNSYPRSTP